MRAPKDGLVEVNSMWTKPGDTEAKYRVDRFDQVRDCYVLVGPDGQPFLVAPRALLNDWQRGHPR